MSKKICVIGGGRWGENHIRTLHEMGNLGAVVDMNAARLAELKEKGVKLIDEKPRRGAGGAMIAFLHPKATGGVLLELCERK